MTTAMMMERMGMTGMGMGPMATGMMAGTGTMPMAPR